ncbi:MULTISPECIES: copper resistance CopC family protein [Streptomyces]|uniref:copper resistance CopC family protein n=1 Tax=Streptomyces TaxID=1883 RepID=UPI0006AFF224|nr:copper resistance CopC family protein [Streptomyces sp. AS58]
MHVIRRRAARTAARFLVVPAALAALAATAGPAAAHTELEAAGPGANARLAALPPRVTLTFSDTMTQKFAKVAVTAPNGDAAAQGEPRVEGRTVTLLLDTDAPAGRYTVGYRVVSADGHPVSGSYTFTVEEAADPTPTPTPTAGSGSTVRGEEPTTRAEPVARQGGGGSSGATVAITAGAGALAVAAAAVAATLLRRRNRHGD